jgi:hypothetical protein
LVGAGSEAGAVTRCGSGSDGSGSDNGIKHGEELKNDSNESVYNPFSSYFQQYLYTVNRTESYKQDTIVSTCMLTLVRFKNFALLYSRIGTGAGAAGAALKFVPGAGARSGAA